MPLDKTALKAGVKQLTTDLFANTTNVAQAREDFADRLSTLINDFVKTGTVSVTVHTTGTASAQAGSGTGSIS